MTESSPVRHVRFLFWYGVVAMGLVLAGTRPAEAQPADIVLVGGTVCTVDGEDRVAEGVAVRGERILAVGSDDEMRRHIGPDTNVIDLEGKTVVPGFIETHTHALGAARSELRQPWVDLDSIPAIQDWLRRRAGEVPAGQWIDVPRVDVTRLKERRHPRVDELDAACDTHPVSVTAARKTVLNSHGFRTIGVTADDPAIPNGRVLLDGDGAPWMIAGGEAHLRQFRHAPDLHDDDVLSMVRRIHQIYHSVGITSIFERAATKQDWELYQRLQAAGQLDVRTTMTFRSRFRSAEEVREFSEELGLVTGDGDDWLRVGPLKITVDGGIHWGNVRLSEPYGPRRIRLYALDDPDYRGDLNYSVDLMGEIFSEATRLGWQSSCHVTGDAGVAAVLEALEAADRLVPVRDRRFSLIHAYFTDPDWLPKARRLGVGVDTQPYLYFRDSDAIAEFYGESWAERFIGLADWTKHEIPVAINSDHMIGLDPDRAMNSFNPLLMLSIAVTRRNEQGDVYGKHQKLSRLAALRTVTANAAWLSFDEDAKGSLSPGMLADLAVLDRNYLDCPESEIAQIQVLQTLVNGRLVYTRE